MAKITLVEAFAAPVLGRMMLPEAVRPPAPILLLGVVDRWLRGGRGVDRRLLSALDTEDLCTAFSSAHSHGPRSWCAIRGLKGWACHL